jgi:hypothetical protein
LQKVNPYYFEPFSVLLAYAGHGMLFIQETMPIPITTSKDNTKILFPDIIVKSVIE